MADDGLEERRQVSAHIFRIHRCRTLQGNCINNGEVQLLLSCTKGDKEVKSLIHHPVKPGVRPVDLVDDNHGFVPSLQGFGKHKAGLRHRAFHGIDQQEDTVHKAHDALDFAAEVGMAGGVNNVDLDVAVGNRRVLGDNGDPALALQIHFIHDALGDSLVSAEDSALFEHTIHKGGLAVIDVRDNRDIAQVVLRRCLGHSAVVYPILRRFGYGGIGRRTICIGRWDRIK